MTYSALPLPGKATVGWHLPVSWPVRFQSKVVEFFQSFDIQEELSWRSSNTKMQPFFSN
jgi:hypothetical protein